MNRMKLTRRKTLLLIVGGLLIGIGMLEVTYRIYLSWMRPINELKRVEPRVPREIKQFDENLGWSLKPRSIGTSRRTGQKIEYHINSKGLRDDETSYEKPDGVFRIVALGDSFTFGSGVPIEKHFSTLLERYFKNVEVINMGVGGYGVDQAYLFLKSEGFRYEPDIVLVYEPGYYDHRHMHTVRWGKNKPRFVLKDGQLNLTNIPVPKKEKPGMLNGVHRLLGKHLMVYRAIDSRLKRLTNRKEPDRNSIQRQQDYRNIKVKIFKKQLYELGERLIREMHKESKEHGARFVVITRMRKLQKACEKAGILSHNVNEPLSNVGFRISKDDGHLNEPGNGVLAWEIAKFLKENGLMATNH